MPANGLVATSYNLAASAEASVTNTTRNRTSSVCNSLLSVRRSTNGRSRVGQRAEASPHHRRVFRPMSLLDPRLPVPYLSRMKSVKCGSHYVKVKHLGREETR